MSMGEILQAAQTISVLLAIVVAYGTIKSRGAAPAASIAEIKTDIKYIKERVSALDNMRERTARVEASAQSAHKRLDEHVRRGHKNDARAQHGYDN